MTSHKEYLKMRCSCNRLRKNNPLYPIIYCKKCAIGFGWVK